MDSLDRRHCKSMLCHIVMGLPISKCLSLSLSLSPICLLYAFECNHSLLYLFYDPLPLDQSSRTSYLHLLLCMATKNLLCQETNNHRHRTCVCVCGEHVTCHNFLKSIANELTINSRLNISLLCIDTMQCVD